MTMPPWDRGWLQVSPEGFERTVVAFLRNLEGDLAEFSVTHREILSGPDGEFVLDAVVKFEALGAEFLVVVECKHHKNSIKRELVQVLRDKVRSLSADKGMLFSTAPFQSGAVEYARGPNLRNQGRRRPDRSFSDPRCILGRPIPEGRSSLQARSRQGTLGVLVWACNGYNEWRLTTRSSGPQPIRVAST